MKYLQIFGGFFYYNDYLVIFYVVGVVVVGVDIDVGFFLKVQEIGQFQGVVIVIVVDDGGLGFLEDVGEIFIL